MNYPGIGRSERNPVIALTHLVERLAHGLEPVGQFPVGRLDLTGVHISELDDPTPYLEGGELLLTTGIPFAKDTDIPAYVSRLQARGVAALGLGLGAGTDSVPPDLRSACERIGVPLFVVPEGTPFMHVSRTYWDLVGATVRADLAASLSLQTSLAQAATRPEAVSAVVKVLATALGGWSIYLPADGAPETCWPRSSRQVLPQLRAETRRLDLAGTRTAASFALDGMDVLEYSIIDGKRTAGFLAVCAGRTLRSPDRQLIATGTMLLAVTAQREWQTTRANAIVGAAAATLLMNGYVDAARLVAAELARTPLPEFVQLLAIRAENAASLSTAEVADQIAQVVAPTESERLRASIRASRLRSDVSGVSFLILEQTVELDELMLAGPVNAGNQQDTPQNTSQNVAHHAARLAGVIGRPLLLRDVHSIVAELRRTCLGVPAGQLITEPGALDSRADRWVTSLAGHTRADLIGTVTSYIRHRGQWEAASRELGIHRNSLRNRIAIVSTMIGADIDDPDVSSNLWLALRRT